jgi:hypothetical protein
MNANSKLNAAEKSILKDMIESNPNVQFEQTGKTTFAFQRVGNLVKFATAIRADNEVKNRRKVGKYWAITRFDAGQTALMRESDFNEMVTNMAAENYWD